MPYPPDPLEDDATNDTALVDEHPQRHNSTADAVNDIVAELGTDPSGASADLTARLTTLDGTVAAKETPAGAQAKVDAHVNDTTDAHDATAISFAPAGTIAATNVQAAIEEVAAEAGGGVSDGDKGDITVSGSGATWTVDNNAITLAKLADIATARILGRVTASSGDPEELTAAQVKTLLAIAAADVSDITAFVRTLLDDADAAAALATLGAASSGHAHGWGFPMTLDPSLPRSSDVASGGGANVGNYLRVIGSGTISKVGLRVGTQAGDISVAVYANSGAGRSSVPGTRLATSGEVACPAAGYAEVALDGTVAVAEGDWLAVSTSSASATFRALVAGAVDSDIALGAQFRQSAAHPLPSAPSSLVAEHGRRIVLVGVA